jgi:hypothetical protein
VAEISELAAPFTEQLPIEFPRERLKPPHRRAEMLFRLQAMLRERRDTFRAGYRAWRQGGFKGAAGEIEDVSVMKPAHEPTRSRDATDCVKRENKRCELLGEPADEQAGEPGALVFRPLPAPYRRTL